HAGMPSIWILLSTEPTAAMGIIFLSILGFNPMFCLVIGAIAGSDIKGLWYAPFITFIVFIPYSCWLLRGFVPEMLIYGGIYLAAAFLAMGFSHKIFEIIRIKKEEKTFMARKSNRKNEK
ncbi:MAG: hypothetical protein IKT50_03820, partial [Clostridia bacterium]|nr:hypothetical protein [Clostridia bacterium]